jgi:hypothetical protein
MGCLLVGGVVQWVVLEEDPWDVDVRVATTLLMQLMLSLAVLIADNIWPIWISILSRRELACSNTCFANVVVCIFAQLLRLSL